MIGLNYILLCLNNNSQIAKLQVGTCTAIEYVVSKQVLLERVSLGGLYFLINQIIFAPIDRVNLGGGGGGGELVTRLPTRLFCHVDPKLWKKCC